MRCAEHRASAVSRLRPGSLNRRSFENNPQNKQKKRVEIPPRCGAVAWGGGATLLALASAGQKSRRGHFDAINVQACAGRVFRLLSAFWHFAAVVFACRASS